MASKRILYVSRWFPDPPDNGSRLRVWGQLRALAPEYHLTLVSFVEPGQSGQPSAELKRICPRVFTVPRRPFRPLAGRAIAGLLAPRPRSLVDTHSAEMRRLIETEVRSGRHDFVHAGSLDMTSYVDAFGDLPSLVDDMEVGAYAERTQGSPLATAPARLTWAKLVFYLRRVLPRFRAAVVASDIEAALLRRAVPGYDRITVIENAVDTRACAPRPDGGEEARLVFAGSLTYEPNLDAMHWFCRRILPRIRALLPEVRLTITGALPAGGFAAPEGVDLAGLVDDVRPIVASATVSVAPIRRGGGTRLKILEAMALGTPVVATSKGAEGLAAVHGEHLLLADDPGVFAAHVIRLLGDAQLRRRLSGAARALVERRYDSAVTGRMLASLIDRILDEAGAGACR